MNWHDLQMALVVLIMLLPARSNAGFAELGFCPLGGPPGWFNRLTGQHEKRYYPPPPARYRWFTYPAMQSRPANSYPSLQRLEPAPAR